MFKYRKGQLRVAVFVVGSIGLACSAHAQTQSIFGVPRERTQLECICVEEIGGAKECALDVGFCFEFDSNCTASHDAHCPNGLCLTAASTGCPTNLCLSQSTDCDRNCPTPTSIGNIVPCPEETEMFTTPTVSEWSLIIMTVLAFTTGTILFGRRRRGAA